MKPCSQPNGKQAVEQAVKSCSNQTKSGYQKSSVVAFRKANQDLEGLYQSLMEGIHIGISMIDVNCRILMVNNHVLEIFKKTTDEIIGQKCYRMFARRTSICPNCPGRQAIETGKPVESIIEGIYDNDKTSIYRIHAFPMIDQDGTATGFVKIVQNIIEQKKTEETNRKSEKRFRDIFDNTLIGLYRTTPDGKILMANQAIVQMLGYSSFEELSHLNLEEDRFPSDCPRSIFKQLIEAEGQVVDLETTWLKRDGSKMFIRESAKAVRDETGKTMYYEGTIIDITEHKQAEQKLLKDRSLLQYLVSQLSLTEERERRRLATELHDQIGQSLVISKIKLDKIRHSKTSGEIANVLTEVSNCLEQIIQETRTLTFDLSSPLLYECGFETAVAEWLSSQIQEKHGIRTEFENDGRPKPLSDDICMILFRNVRELLINVIKHSHADKVKVSIQRKNEKIQISIVDNGIGFNTSEVTSKAVEKFTFGLFSIRQRLDILGGKLEIKSQSGCGSRITMTAPLKYSNPENRQ